LLPVIFAYPLTAQTGIPVAGLTQCDNLAKKFLSNYNIPGGYNGAGQKTAR